MSRMKFNIIERYIDDASYYDYESFLSSLRKMGKHHLSIDDFKHISNIT